MVRGIAHTVSCVSEPEQLHIQRQQSSLLMCGPRQIQSLPSPDGILLLFGKYQVQMDTGIVCKRFKFTHTRGPELPCVPSQERVHGNFS